MKSTIAWVALLATLVGAPAARAADVVYHNRSAVIGGNLPFSEAVRVGDTLYLSGMLGVKPGTMELVSGGIEAEARQAMENIRQVLGHYDLGLDDLVKCTVMMADIGEWGQFNQVYSTFFGEHYPARSAFGATGLGLNARVEIDCIAAYSDAAH